jgi:hypothetical protein
VDRNEVFAKVWEAYEAGELIPACAWCGCVRIGEEWLERPHGALSTIDAQMTLSHSICPRCLEAHLSPKSREARAPRAEGARARLNACSAGKIDSETG